MDLSTMPEIRACNIVDPGCTAPPGERVGGDFESTRASCFACGLPVCLNCSAIRTWFSYGRRRICRSCWDEEENWRVRAL